MNQELNSPETRSEFDYFVLEQQRLKDHRGMLIILCIILPFLMFLLYLDLRINVYPQVMELIEKTLSA